MKHSKEVWTQEALAISSEPSDVKLLLRMAACVIVLVALLLLVACSKSNPLVVLPNSGPVSTITPGWTIPAPPSATLNQSYTASVPEQAGCTYLWSVVSGSATLIGTTTSVVTFTPTATGSLKLQCVVTNSSNKSSTGTYSITVGSGAVLNANPDTITLGQGTILLATFSSGSGTIDHGVGSVTSDVGVTVTPAATTTYIL